MSLKSMILSLGMGLSLAAGSGCATTTESRQEVFQVQVQVEDGDTLNTIAEQFDTNWRDIIRLNRATLKNGLRVGQVLSIVPGRDAVTAVRQKGDNHDEIFEEGEDDLKFVPKNRGLLFGGKKSKAEMDFIFPVEGRITSHFGKRGRRMHKGIDIGVNVGTPILATAAGEVIFSGKRRGYGGTVVIDHGGFISLYAHCSSMIAKVGDTVAQGEYIAKSGRTGNARGAHLHFEIRDSANRPIDPEPLLRHHKTLSENLRKAKAKADMMTLVSSNPAKATGRKRLLYTADAR